MTARTDTAEAELIARLAAPARRVQAPVARPITDGLDELGRRLGAAARRELARPHFEQLQHADGRPLELEPWQRAILEQITGDRHRRLGLTTGLRAGRTRDAARMLAAAALLGEDVAIASTSSAEARDLAERARAELAHLSGALGLHADPPSSLGRPPGKSSQR